MLTGEPKQRLEGRHGCTAPVEPEDELVEVMGQVFPAHAAVSAPEPRLEVSEYPMDPREQCRGLLGHSLSRRPMIIPTLLERRISLPAVRPNRAPRRHGCFDEPDQRPARHVRRHAEPNSAGAAATNFHGSDDDRLALPLHPPPGPLPRRRHRPRPLRRSRRCGRARVGSSRDGVCAAWSTRSGTGPDRAAAGVATPRIPAYAWSPGRPPRTNRAKPPASDASPSPP